MFISENNKQKIVNLIFSLIPLSFVCGNLIINLNIILLIFISFIFFNKKLFGLKLNFFDKTFSFFFITLFFAGILNSYFFYFPEKSIWAEEIFLKSFLYLRFFLVYFIIRFLIDNEILKLRLFFITAALCSIFVSLDVILQFITGKDIFGYESFSRRYPGPFGDEAISGSYLQRFSLFIFFLFPIFFSNKIKNSYILSASVIFILVFCATLFSGNKFPFVMFIFSIIILLILIVRSKKLILSLFIFSVSIFFIFFKYNFEVKNNFGNFYSKISQVQIYTKSILDNIKNDTEVIIPNTWIKEMHHGLLAFNSKKLFGGGIKSYKISCPKFAEYSCAPHPHNYHIEILVSAGLFGYFFLLIFFVKFLINFYKNYFLFKGSNNLMLMLFSTLFFIEFFPLRTTGSFFSTANATYFCIIMSIAISLILRKTNKQIL